MRLYFERQSHVTIIPTIQMLILRDGKTNKIYLLDIYISFAKWSFGLFKEDTN